MPLYANVFQSLAGAGHNATRQSVSTAFQMISAFANLTFDELTSGSADLGFGALNYPHPEAGSWASPGNQPGAVTDAGDVSLTSPALVGALS